MVEDLAWAPDSANVHVNEATVADVREYYVFGILELYGDLYLSQYYHTYCFGSRLFSSPTKYSRLCSENTFLSNLFSP